MVKFFPSLSPSLTTWALSQPLFFTATAPLHGAHINVSPKGLPTSSLAIPTPNSLLYLDSTGSGIETISHLYENGRLTIMFISFSEIPRIMRLFCKGRVVERWLPGFKENSPNTRGSISGVPNEGRRESPDYMSLLKGIGKGTGELFPTARAIIVCDIWKVQTSCGYGVPVLKSIKIDGAETDITASIATGAEDSNSPVRKTFEDRTTLTNWGQSQLEKGAIQNYHIVQNCESLDGLPGLRSARSGKGEVLVLGDLKARVKRVMVSEWESVLFGFILGIFFMVLLRNWEGSDVWEKWASWERRSGFVGDW